MTAMRRDEPASSDILLAEVAEDFTQRARRGERADIDDYVRNYPELAEVIRDVFPALALMNDPLSYLAGDDAMRASQGRTDQLGDFYILREVGRGGMGVVYEAEQISLARRVALKVLPFAAALDSRQLQRFQNEAQAAAQLHHTNIVPVFGTGREGGVHFYAMQYIDGEPLSAVVHDLNSLCRLESDALQDSRRSRVLRQLLSGCGTGSNCVSGDPGGEPDSTAASPTISSYAADASADSAPPLEFALRDVHRSSDYLHVIAELGIQAAEALDHAHQVGVIHRDIKPANLLLDTCGHLWITDFGLALVQADPRLTVSGDLVGTLRYMSPEQVLAQRTMIDHRTDVYSLGVTLYELVTLQAAFPGQNQQELLRQVALDEPTPPRRLNPAIPRTLEAIVLKAIAKRPEERYGTAAELADDLRRFRGNEPIIARHTNFAQRTAKWVRRHKRAAWSAAIALLLTTSGFVAHLARIAHAHSETEAAYRRETTARARAEDQTRVAVQMATEAQQARRRAEHAAQEAQSVVHFLVNDLLGSAAPETSLGRDLSVGEVLDNAERRIASTFEGQSVSEAAVRYALGVTYVRRGDYKRAEEHLRRALTLRVQEFGKDDQSTLDTATALGNAYFKQGRFDETLTVLDDVLQRRERLLGKEHEQTLRSMGNLASALAVQGQFDRAYQLSGQVLEIQDRVLGPEHSDTLITKNNAAALLGQLGRWNEARVQFEETLNARRHTLGEDHPDTLVTMLGLVRVLRDCGETAQAINLCQDLLVAQRRVLGTEHPATLSSCGTLASLMRAGGKLEKAHQLYEEAVELHRKTLGEPSHGTLLMTVNWAGVLKDLGRRQEARELLAPAVDELSRTLGEDHPDTLAAKGSLAAVLRSLGEREAALRLHQSVLEGCRRTFPENHAQTLGAMNNVSNVLHDLGRRDESIALRREAVAMHRRTFGPDHPQSLMLSYNLAVVLGEYGDLDEARQLHQETLDFRMQVLGPNHPDTIRSFKRLRALQPSLAAGVILKTNPAVQAKE